MEPRKISNEAEYEAVLAEVERLIALDPDPGTQEADRLAVLALLVEAFEKERFHFALPSPIEAIRFRMEEKGLKQRDLISFIGSASKVSEVLSGKRQLTLSMIRALHKGLGIPAEILLRAPEVELKDQSDIRWEKFPVREMAKLGWIQASARDLKERSGELAKHFFLSLGGQTAVKAFYRRTFHKRSDKPINEYATHAWVARALFLTKSRTDLNEYRPGTVTQEFIKEVVRLSWSERGPLLAQEFLAKKGIALILLPHLTGTHLDGIALLSESGRPVIGLTLRYDRIDWFWFTLTHELEHVAKHFESPDDVFIDDLESPSGPSKKEQEADVLANETLIPKTEWRRSAAFRQRTPESVKELAAELGIHPAIIAGRIRFETKNYQILKDLIGSGQLRKLFQNA